MKSFVQPLTVGLTIVVASFPLQAWTDDDTYIWSLAVVAATAAWLVSWVERYRIKRNERKSSH